MRGQVTDAIKEKAKELLGIEEISTAELRFMPYVHYVMSNDQRIDPRKITHEERKILSGWRAKGWVEGGASGLSITKEFWDALNEIVWLGYVAFEE